ncbi:hypothetical protein BsWGS_23582 [Bradybaena similaris]
MTAQVEGPFDYTATGVLGDKRKTMLRNELHLRNKVGSVKSRGFVLPEKSRVYGMPSGTRDYTVACALRGWAGTFPESSTAAGTKLTTERDFMTLNRAALSGGLTEAGQHFDYRATHDIRRPPFRGHKSAGRLHSRRLPPTMVFGTPSRPSTPIFELLEHKFQDQWLKEKQKLLEAKRSEAAKKRVMSAPVISRGRHIIYETRASLLRTYQNPVDPPPLWQLPRFTKSARPHIQTFKTESVKSAALRNLETDKIARQ